MADFMWISCLAWNFQLLLQQLWLIKQVPKTLAENRQYEMADSAMAQRLD